MRFLLVCIACLCASPALALTGKDIWQNWQMAASARGWFVKDSTVKTLPDGLQVTDVVLTNGEGMKVAISGLTFADRPGGAVDIAFGPKIELFETLLTAPLVTIESEGAVLRASDAADTGFALEARSLTLAGTAPGAAGDVARIALKGLAGSFALQAADHAGMIPVAMALKAAETSFTLKDGAAKADPAVVEGVIPGLDVKLQATMPAGMAGPDNLTTEEEFRAGFSFDLSVKNGALQASVTSGDTGMKLAGLACSATMHMEQSGFAVRDACGTGEVRLKGPEMPFEAVLTLQKLMMQVAGPVNSMAVPGDLNFVVALDGAQVNDEIWAMADAKNALPHDPMSLALDFGMLARWNIFDEATTEDFKPLAMDLRRLDLDMAGVKASFSGHGTMDPASGEEPAFKDGVLDGRVSGVNRLLNAIVASGVVASGDVFPIRAGLSMVFNPGAGEDELTTHVEQRADGSVFVNGVQMK